MEKFIHQKLLKMVGGGMHTQHTPHPLWIRPWLYNKRWPQILRVMFLTRNSEGSLGKIVVRKSKKRFLVKLVKRYPNVSDLVLF